MNRKSAARHIFALGLLSMLAGFFCFSAAPAFAVTIVPSCARCSGPTCPPPSLSCALATFRNVASLIVGVTGSFALLMFVYGGFMLLTSGGVEAKVTTGKTILKNAMIGIVLVFTAGYIIDYAVKRLQGYREIVAGQSCNNGEGTYNSVSGRGMICQTPCTARSLRDAGYQCTTDPAATGCSVDYIGCSGSGGSNRCCIPPPPPPPEAPPSEEAPPESPF
ncbi:MAG TPA: pilin [Candidatus Eisenbacteria bacterium]|jgi:hypothetical protein|nr:pilin [Candidatus Eisenbacteria bacterium]